MWFWTIISKFCVQLYPIFSVFLFSIFCRLSFLFLPKFLATTFRNIWPMFRSVALLNGEFYHVTFLFLFFVLDFFSVPVLFVPLLVFAYDNSLIWIVFCLIFFCFCFCFYRSSRVDFYPVSGNAFLYSCTDSLKISPVFEIQVSLVCTMSCICLMTLRGWFDSLFMSMILLLDFLYGWFEFWFKLRVTCKKSNLFYLILMSILSPLDLKMGINIFLFFSTWQPFPNFITPGILQFFAIFHKT